MANLPLGPWLWQPSTDSSKGPRQLGETAIRRAAPTWAHQPAFEKLDTQQGPPVSPQVKNIIELQGCHGSRDGLIRCLPTARLLRYMGELQRKGLSYSGFLRHRHVTKTNFAEFCFHKAEYLTVLKTCQNFWGHILELPPPTGNDHVRNTTLWLTDMNIHLPIYFPYTLTVTLTL